MERNTYRLIDVAQTLLQAFPLGANTDTVVISIYDVDDAAMDVSQSAMTTVTGNQWKYSWTPSQNHNFVVDYWNQTLDVHDYEYIQVVGSLTGVPGGSGTGSMLSTLRTRFLKLIDNFNANDLTGTNSSGEVADLCINEALQEIYAQLKASRYLEAYGSTALISVSGQDYIELSGITDLDEIKSIKDTTNNLTLFYISAADYFFQIPNPANVSGTPYRFCRIFNRVYLTPRPDSAITYTTEYIKNYARLSSDSDRALIPGQYDNWIYAEAKVLWLEMEDSSNVTAIREAKLERAEKRDLYMGAIMAQFGRNSQAQSNFRSPYPYQDPFKSLNIV